MCLLATVVVTAAAVTQALGCKTPTPSSNMCTNDTHTKTTIHHIDQADFYQLFPVCRRAPHWGKNQLIIQKLPRI